MNRYTIAFLLAMLIVLAGVTLRKSFATSGGLNSAWRVTAIGGAPVPAALPTAMSPGDSYVGVAPQFPSESSALREVNSDSVYWTARPTAIGGSPVSVTSQFTRTLASGGAPVPPIPQLMRTLASGGAPVPPIPQLTRTLASGGAPVPPIPQLTRTLASGGAPVPPIPQLTRTLASGGAPVPPIPQLTPTLA